MQIPLAVVVHCVESLSGDAAQVHIGPVVQHLRGDLPAVDDRPRGLAQVIQRRLAAKDLCKSSSHCK